MPFLSRSESVFYLCQRLLAWWPQARTAPGLRSCPSPGARLLKWEGRLGQGRLRGSSAGSEDVYEGLGFEPLSVESSPGSRVDARMKLTCRAEQRRGEERRGGGRGGEEGGAGVSAPEEVGLEVEAV